MRLIPFFSPGYTVRDSGRREEEGGVNGNPWVFFEAEWKENISGGFARGKTGFLTSVTASGLCV